MPHAVQHCAKMRNSPQENCKSALPGCAPTACGADLPRHDQALKRLQPAPPGPIIRGRPGNGPTARHCLNIHVSPGSPANYTLMWRHILHGSNAHNFNPAYRWGMLAVILALIYWGCRIEGSRQPFSWVAWGTSQTVPFMLLFNHLASAFAWPRLVQFSLNILSMSVTIGAAFVVASVMHPHH